MHYHYQLIYTPDGGTTKTVVFESNRVTRLAGGDGDIWFYVDGEALPEIIFHRGTWTYLVRIRPGVTPAIQAEADGTVGK